MIEKKKRPDPASTIINLRLGTEGVVSVEVLADSAAAEAAAHQLLAGVTAELRALHLALMAQSVRAELLKREGESLAQMLKEN
jgi:hypothetical protein